MIASFLCLIFDRVFVYKRTCFLVYLDGGLVTVDSNDLTD